MKLRSGDILCPICETICGREIPASCPTFESGGEPGYREGPGEEFEGPDGIWYCSAECETEGVIGRP